MIDVKESLVTLLRASKFPVFQQGDFGDSSQYPPAFVTYWNNETNGESYYDDKNHRCVWRFTVYFYSNDKDLTNTVLLQIINTLTAGGWEIDGKGYDVPSDRNDFTGRAVDVLFIEREV